jgi:hypothetical protein
MAAPDSRGKKAFSRPEVALEPILGPHIRDSDASAHIKHALHFE